MRKITLTHILEPDGDSYYQKKNCYTIALGNGVVTRWSNFELAETFLVKINLKLNYKLVTINQILIETYSHYRKVWFYVTNYPEYNRLESNIEVAFNSINHNLKMATTRGHFENGNHFVFKHLFGILDYLNEILSALQKVEKHSKHYVDVRMLEVFKDRVTYARDDLNMLGRNEGNLNISEGSGTMG